jgi:hypothetical protein
MKQEAITVEEFNRRVPLIDRICNSIIECWANVVRLRNVLTNLEKTATKDLTPEEQEIVKEQVSAAQGDLNNKITAMHGYIKEIEAMGGRVMEMQRAYVVFPFVHGAALRWICYCPQDNGAEYWINYDETPKDRRRIQ